MQTQIGYVKITTLQQTLDQVYGQGIFTVMVEQVEYNKNFFLQYDNNTSQSNIDGAIQLALQNSTEYLNIIKINLYEKLNGKAEKAIAAKNSPVYTSEEIQLSVDWLANQQLPIPGCVQFLSLTQNISTLAAAQLISNSAAEYQSYINAVNNVKTTAQSQIMAANDVVSAKLIATNANIEMKDI